jgi:hypothetical protein
MPTYLGETSMKSAVRRLKAIAAQSHGDDHRSKEFATPAIAETRAMRAIDCGEDLLALVPSSPSSADSSRRLAPVQAYQLCPAGALPARKL